MHQLCSLEISNPVSNSFIAFCRLFDHRYEFPRAYRPTRAFGLSFTPYFAAVIAFHNKDLKIAKYYYKQIKADAKEYKELQVKILEEVALAIQTAQFVLDVCPEADIELHIDIGTKKKNATAKFFKSIHGWVTGTGFNLRVKPNSWASSLADGHTKGRNKNGNNNKESKRNSKVNK